MYFKPLLIASAIFFLVTVQGCVTNAAPAPKVSIPVNWNSGFTLPELLASTIEFTTIEDLKQLIAAPWYADITMIHTKAGDCVFNTCQNYFDRAIQTTRTAKENEMGPYLEFKVMCEAANLFLSAKNATSSYLPERVLSNDLPNLLPKSVALQTSLEESKRNANNVALRHWADITPLTKYEPLSATKSIYYHEGGYQELEIIGRGDTNNDGIEDVIVVVHDYLDGGNYMNIRLLVLSVDTKDNWQLIKML